MALNKTAVLLVFIQTCVLANLYCLSSACTDCSSGYNFFNTSCLLFCPSGYFISGKKCVSSSSLELFYLNFVTFRKFESNSINTFSHPEKYKFNSESIKTPISTFDRGFYFSSSSYLVSNISWILSPTFCFSILYRVLSPGIIFEITDDSRLYFGFMYNSSIIYHLNVFNRDDEISLIVSKPENNQWSADVFIFTQYRDYINVYLSGTVQSIYSKEFRMNTNLANYYFGSPSGTFIIKNSNSFASKASSINNCLYNQYLGSSCIDNPSSCSIPFSIDSSCRNCSSPYCKSCSGYLPEHCESCSTEALDLCLFGKNCLNGSLLICFDCEKNFILVDGLCIYPPTNFSTTVLRLDKFTMYQGDYFQSGLNASTYSPFNNPENDDPIALKNRGYFFNNSQNMVAKNFVFNYSFLVYCSETSKIPNFKQFKTQKKHC